MGINFFLLKHTSKEFILIKKKKKISSIIALSMCLITTIKLWFKQYERITYRNRIN